MRERSHNSCETKHLGWLGTDGENCMKFSNVLIRCNCVFSNLFSRKFLWCISPVFEGLHINHGWQAARLSCWRSKMWSAPTGVMYRAGNNTCIQPSRPRRAFMITYHRCFKCTTFLVFSRYPSEERRKITFCVLCLWLALLTRTYFLALKGLGFFCSIKEKIPSQARDINRSSTLLLCPNMGRLAWQWHDSLIWKKNGCRRWNAVAQPGTSLWGSDIYASSLSPSFPPTLLLPQILIHNSIPL